jgi:hypothetical protein
VRPLSSPALNKSLYALVAECKLHQVHAMGRNTEIPARMPHTVSDLDWWRTATLEAGGKAAKRSMPVQLSSSSSATAADRDFKSSARPE